MNVRALVPLFALALAAATCADAPAADGDGAARLDGLAACGQDETFTLGAGVYDITGPAAELGMMGYAMLEQKTAGVHQRLRSRAFVVGSACTGKRAVFVSADLMSISQAVKQGVVEKLQARYGSLYGHENVMLSATHTHAGPGGYIDYALYNLTVLGFDKQNYDAVVEGIFQSVVRAHEAAVPGRARRAEGQLAGAAVNRSRAAYLRNPAAEIGGAPETDQAMTLLRFDALDGRALGTVNWFAVHPTSMGNDNQLISGDNKGYASYLFERSKGTDYLAPGPAFVAAFAQSNEGDVSPNIFGGTQGEGANDFESTAASGKRQYDAARALYDAATQPLGGGVDYRFAYVKLDEVALDPADTGEGPQATCRASIGVSMLAGAEDGPGFGREGFSCEDVGDAFDLGDALVCEGLSVPCQGEKPVVLETGAFAPPWTPNVLPLQILRLGKLALVGVPFEMTTVAGRRLRQTVLDELAPAGVDRVVIAGLANSYAGYVATREEYAAQHYEGASTHFGPHTLAALRQEFARVARALRDGAPLASPVAPPDLRGQQHTIQTGVVFDATPLGKSFGSVIAQPAAAYQAGQTVSASFWGAHPKNNLRSQDSFLRVERSTASGWKAVAHDWDWETTYRWQRDNCFPTFACSRVTVTWAIPPGTAPGTYRLRHDGDWKAIGGQITPYQGVTRTFVVQ
ncbi:MAG TPA: neutral/alkaline non-lysosomal ceramidase N-terminal domain-containing protein [Polyangiaceae bacterium]|nr:neutral/alkaline non-lysosomal ceramidase N-terminal domain-containing protein [Polyangiaceae bacterium]